MGVPEFPKNAKGLTAYEIAIRTSHDCQSVSEVMYYYLFLNFRLAHSAFTPDAANRGVDVDSSDDARPYIRPPHPSETGESFWTSL